jgi:hypothetical protein
MFRKLISNLANGLGAEARENRRLDKIHGPERKPKYPGVLAKRLLSYPPYTPLHVGAPDGLSDAQIEANFAAFMASKAARFALFAGLLAEFNIEITPLLEPSVDPVPVIDAIENWMLEYLPERKDLPPHNSLVNAPYEAMWASDRAGADIIFTLAADYAIAIGETFTARTPKLNWAVDRTPLSNPKLKDGGRSTWKRIVILVEKQKDWRDTPMYAADDVALSAIYWLRSRSGGMATTSWSIKNWLDSDMAK